jgi:hypothetical protein
MQLLYQSRDAKHDYSALRRQRVAELARSSVLPSSAASDDANSYDPVWENAMQSLPDQHDPDPDNVELAVSMNSVLTYAATERAGFYRVVGVDRSCVLGQCMQAGEEDALHAEQSMKKLQVDKEAVIQGRYDQAVSNTVAVHYRPGNDAVPEPLVTDQSREKRLADNLRARLAL